MEKVTVMQEVREIVLKVNETERRTGAAERRAMRVSVAKLLSS